MNRHMKYIPLLLISTAALLACTGGEPDAGAAIAEPGPVTVAVQHLTAQDWQGSVETFGVIEALEEVDVAAELSGTVVAVHVSEGDRVEAGQLLLELDAEKRELAVRQARQTAEQARTALDEARSKLKRRKELAAQETISEEVLDNSRLAVDSAAALYERALASLQLAQRELADTRIISPTAGLVDVKAVEPGEAVAVGATLVKLQAVSVLRVHTWVSEKDVAFIRSGAPAQVSISGMPGPVFEARIGWVGVNADPATGNFPVKLILQQESDSIRPGMTATALIQGLERSGVMLLPERALVDRDRRRVVFVVEDGRAVLREPRLVAGLGDQLVVLAGLSPGDQIVVSGHHQLVDGKAVRIESP